MRPRSIRSLSDSPSSSSSTRYGTPSCVPTSCTARMLGWESAAVALASRSKRLQALGVGSELGGQHLDRDVTAQARVPGP